MIFKEIKPRDIMITPRVCSLSAACILKLTWWWEYRLLGKGIHRGYLSKHAVGRWVPDGRRCSPKMNISHPSSFFFFLLPLWQVPWPCHLCNWTCQPCMDLDTEQKCKSPPLNRGCSTLCPNDKKVTMTRKKYIQCYISNEKFPQPTL